GTRRVHDTARGDLPPPGADSLDALPRLPTPAHQALDPSGVVLEPDPEPAGRFDVPAHDLERHDIPIDRAKRPPDQVVRANRRRQPPNLVRAHLPNLLQTGRPLD